jgi:hypothetical protein
MKNYLLYLTPSGKLKTVPIVVTIISDGINILCPPINENFCIISVYLDGKPVNSLVFSNIENESNVNKLSIINSVVFDPDYITPSDFFLQDTVIILLLPNQLLENFDLETIYIKRYFQVNQLFRSHLFIPFIRSYAANSALLEVPNVAYFGYFVGSNPVTVLLYGSSSAMTLPPNQKCLFTGVTMFAFSTQFVGYKIVSELT